MRPDAARAGVDDPRDWIVQADTDEWLRIPDARARLAVVPPEYDVVMVQHASRTKAELLGFDPTADW